MQDFQQRVIDEHHELARKIGALEVFLRGETFKGLPSDEQERLFKQLVFMKAYDDILVQRFNAFQG